jgi:mannosyltransferase
MNNAAYKTSVNTVTQHDDPVVIVFNLKHRYTGVSATVNALVPLQLRQWPMAYCGTPLSNGVPGMTLRQAIRLSHKPPTGRAFRIWHVRRDPEMMAGLWARDVLRLPVKLVFTSAAQHLHGLFPRWLISRMDAVISTTPLAASFVPNTTAVVPHGIDLSRFSPPADKLSAWASSGLPGQYGIGVFGRVRPDKGSDVFVHAMLQALPQLPGCTAVIAGLAQPQYQAYQQDLQRQIDAAGLHDRVVFLGEVPAGQVHQWYQRCLLCVACPRYEPFGLTPFEAAAAPARLINWPFLAKPANSSRPATPQAWPKRFLRSCKTPSKPCAWARPPNSALRSTLAWHKRPLASVVFTNNSLIRLVAHNPSYERIALAL